MNNSGIRTLAGAAVCFFVGCASPMKHPGIESFGTRTGTSINHELSEAAQVISLNVASAAIISLSAGSIAGPFTVQILPVVFRGGIK